MPPMPKKPHASEWSEQCAIISWWHMYRRGPFADAQLFHIPNGGRRDRVTAAKMKAAGVVPGIPDLMLAYPAGDFHGLFIELKRRDGGRTTARQDKIIRSLEAVGYACAVCHGWLEAKDAILEYLGGAF